MTADSLRDGARSGGSLWSAAAARLGMVRCVVDAAGVVLEVDPEFAALCRQPADEIVGAPIGRFCDALAGRGFCDVWRALGRTGRLRLEARVTAGDEVTPLAFDAVRFVTPDGVVCAGLLGTTLPPSGLAATVDQARLDFLLSESDDGIFDWDLVTDRVFVSAGGQRLFDLSEAEHPDARALFLRVMHVDDRPAVEDQLRQLLAAEIRTMQAEVRVVHGSGRPGWVMLRARAADRRADGRARRVVGSVVDITARRRMEQNLRRERDLLDAVMGTSVTALIVQDPTGALVYANPEAARMLGCSRAELLTRLRRPASWQMCRLDGRPMPVAEHPHRRVVESGEPIVGMRFGLATADARRISVSVNSAPTRGPEGHINRVVSTFEDITDRLAIETALRASERELREVLDRLPVAVGLVGCDGVVRAVNPAAAALFGVSEEALVGVDTFGTDWPIFDEAGERVSYPQHPFFAPWLAGQPVRDRVLTVHPVADGTPCWVLASAMPRCDAQGQVQDVVCTLTDISLRKQMEWSLLQAQKVESIGQLAGGIAHDFNNLLTAVLGGAELVALDLEPDHVAQDDLRRIIEAAQRGAALTHQLLGYARKQPIRPRVVDMSALVSRAAGMLERLIGEDVRLHLALRPDIRVCLDPGQFDQILLNLAVNARDAMPGGGDLYLETDDHAELTHGDTPLDSVGVLRVRDAGEGIPPDVIPRIFDPFFSTKTSGEGTGLGLAVCFGIARQNAGAIGVDSVVGGGTTFEVVFPRVGRSADPSLSIEPRPPVVGHGTVLLVEDDNAVRETARRALTRAGFTVISAGDGAQALFLIESGPPLDGVVTDVVMPALSGRSLADAISEHHPDIPVLFTSGHADDLLGEHGIIRDGVDFLPKPYTPEILCRRVQALLARGPRGDG